MKKLYGIIRTKNGWRQMTQLEVLQYLQEDKELLNEYHIQIAMKHLFT